MIREIKNIRFEKLMEKSKSIDAEMAKLIDKKTDSLKDRIKKQAKYCELMEKSDKIQKQIDRILDIKKL